MSAVAAVFRNLQLFFFAFTLAAICMFSVGIASGKIDRGPIYFELAENVVGFLARNTSLLDRVAGLHRVTVTDARPGQSAATEAAAPHNSLDALKQRQRLRVFTEQHAGSGG